MTYNYFDFNLYQESKIEKDSNMLNELFKNLVYLLIYPKQVGDIDIVMIYFNYFIPIYPEIINFKYYDDSKKYIGYNILYILLSISKNYNIIKILKLILKYKPEIIPELGSPLLYTSNLECIQLLTNSGYTMKNNKKYSFLMKMIKKIK